MKRLFILCLLFTLISCGSSTPDDSDVKNASRAVIIRNLKNLNSAKFHHNEVVKKVSDSIFTYLETVNATNTYGGSVAQNAFVKLKWIGGDPSEISSWSVVDISFSNR